MAGGESASISGGSVSDTRPSTGVLSWLKEHLNFYRVHIIYFTLTPLIFSGILYGANSKDPVAYIDALFLSVTSMTVCGLATVELSGLTAFQQFLMFFQMCLGSPVFVSWVVVMFRRRMFTIRCENIVRAAARKAVSSQSMSSPVASEVRVPTSWTTKLASLFRPGTHLSTVRESADETGTGSTKEKKHPGDREARKLRPDMIRRMNDAPMLVNPSGWISEGRPDPLKVVVMDSAEFNGHEKRTSSSEGSGESGRENGVSGGGRELSFVEEDGSREVSPDGRGRRLSDSYRLPGPRQVSLATDRRPTIDENVRMPRTQTIEFAPSPHRLDRARMEPHPTISEMNFRRPTIDTVNISEYNTGGSLRPPRTPTMGTITSARRPTFSTQADFGGFPWPHQVASRIFRHYAPKKLQHHISRTVTIPRTQTITSVHTNNIGSPSTGARAVPYISFDAVVGRNSVFHSLDSEQLEELGGVEYRALTMLSWIVGGYHIGTQLIGFIIIAAYMTLKKWAEDFVPPMQHRKISTGWFSLFQVVSAYTNTGTSLVDQSMVPFQKAYPMIFTLIFLILAGNTAFAVFLRLTIWVTSKLTPKDSRANETLQFLLDHPRRCFIYLFPSHQTWFLATVLVILNTTDWFFFLILDLGNPIIDAIPVATRVVDGLLQAVAVRAAGFGIVTLSALAPAVRVLYVIMMYVSVYPVAMSVRSTNVYEERSLGIYDDDASIQEEEVLSAGSDNRMHVWSRYLAMHARRQLAFDMWWLGLALFLVCIIEKDQINDPDNLSWFTIFNIVFELVSAYGGVGLSLGVPYANYSFCGAFSTLSKLIVCAVMLRGRHRGLPVAIDRAVVLPFEYRKHEEQDAEADELHSPQQRRPSMRSVPTMMSTGRQMTREPTKPESMGTRRFPRRTSSTHDDVLQQYGVP
ncbi:hypothetical protein FA95DRAFT_1564224 [Auriscalpium vulgare]|uniref:Uncharacterized protein n=1 Tax=Auriscalpium vulgare TaxID=40419 RepID=A0ACB8REY1_9AGAM|nr:hypothetical protein FA95DRAFT_1564224 [Auriscalpium vulgare]